MGHTATLFEVLMAAFFAIACIRAHGPLVAKRKLRLSELFCLSDRLERLKRSQWQWFSMVALLLVIRMQQPVPIVLEALVGMQFVVFMALPTCEPAGARK
jgi:hypothetical protein